MLRNLLLPALAALAGSRALADTVPPHRYADAHVHLVDFFQQGEGVAALVEQMDAARVDAAIVMGVPVSKTWHENEPKRPRYYQGDDAPLYWYSATDALVAEAVRRAPPAARERLYPFICGFNPNDKNAPAHIERMLELYPDTWRGIGEVFTRHDDLTALIPGEAPRADNEAMMRIYRLAARHELPVLLHSNLTSVREREPLYLEELERALSENPDTRFLWAHAGTSAELHRAQGKLKFLHETIEDLLARHDNLWVDLSWSVLEPYLLDADGQPRRPWLALIERHPDRFVIGSDVLGRFDGMGKKLDAFRPVLDALPATVARRVARDNLRELVEGAPSQLRRSKR